MWFTLNSKKHGAQTFWMADKGGYVRLEDERTIGCLAKQICYGGGFRGATVTATPDTFEKECRRWWKQRLATERDDRPSRW